MLKAKSFLCALTMLFLWTAPVTAQNRVLELGGNGSYVELTPNIVKDLDEETVEGWVKGLAFGGHERWYPPQLPFADLQAALPSLP
ncbi:MAG: hypothetical protein AAB466_09500 [Verrucomicrobiota bacterium]